MKTLNELTDDLDRIRGEYPPGSDPSPGETVCYVCLTGIEYQPVREVKLDRDEDGAVIIFCVDLDMEEFERIPNGSQALTQAMERLAVAMKLIARSKPVRDFDEVLLECERVHAQAVGHPLRDTLKRLMETAKLMVAPSNSDWKQDKD